MSNGEESIDYSLDLKLFSKLQESIDPDYTVERCVERYDSSAIQNILLTRIKAETEFALFQTIWIAQVDEISIEDLFSLKPPLEILDDNEFGIIILDNFKGEHCRFFTKEMPNWFPASSKELYTLLRGKFLFKALERFSGIKKPILEDEELEIFMRNATEDDLTENFIIPLFRVMGFENVFARGHRDRHGERGSDSTLIKYDLPFGKTIFFAFQAKRRATTSNISEDLNQTNQILLRTFTDPADGISKVVDFALLIYPEGLTSDAEQTVREYLDGHDRNRKLFVFQGRELKYLFQNHPLRRQDQENIKRIINSFESA